MSPDGSGGTPPPTPEQPPRPKDTRAVPWEKVEVSPSFLSGFEKMCGVCGWVVKKDSHAVFLRPKGAADRAKKVVAHLLCVPTDYRVAGGQSIHDLLG